MSVEVVVVLESHGSSVEGLGGPLAVAVEAVAVSDAVSKAETLSRPVGGGNSVSGVDGNSSVERISIGLSAPLAVAGVELGPLLERSSGTRVGLADGDPEASSWPCTLLRFSRVVGRATPY